MRLESDLRQGPTQPQIGLATGFAAVLLSGVVELIGQWTPMFNSSAALGPTAFGAWTLLWAAVYFVVAMTNSWWLSRYANMPPVGWLSGLCTHFLGSVLIAPLSGILAISLDDTASFLTRYGEGGIAAILISPVTAIAVALGEVLRHVSLKGKPWMTGVAAAGAIIWLLVLLL